MKTAVKLVLSCILALFMLCLLALTFRASPAVAATTTNTDPPPSCLPAPLGTGGPMRVGVSANGQWMWWTCLRADGSDQLVRYLSTRAVTLRAVGERLDVVLRSSSPLTAAQAAHRRYATVSAEDPALAGVYQDYLASLGMP